MVRVARFSLGYQESSRGGALVSRMHQPGTVRENVAAVQSFPLTHMARTKPLKKLGPEHERVSNGGNEWVRGIQHTNTIEGFWSHLKRGITSTHGKKECMLRIRARASAPSTSAEVISSIIFSTTFSGFSEFLIGRPTTK